MSYDYVRHVGENRRTQNFGGPNGTVVHRDLVHHNVFQRSLSGVQDQNPQLLLLESLHQGTEYVVDVLRRANPVFVVLVVLPGAPGQLPGGGQCHGL